MQKVKIPFKETNPEDIKVGDIYIEQWRDNNFCIVMVCTRIIHNKNAELGIYGRFIKFINDNGYFTIGDEGHDYFPNPRISFHKINNQELLAISI